MHPDDLMLIVLAGLPGSGKSMLALALGRALGWPVLDKDTLKSSLLLGGVAEELAGPLSYELLLALGRDLLVEQRLSVILDSPAAYPRVIERAQAIARDAGASLRTILCLAERDLRNRRVEGRVNRLSQPVKAAGSSTLGDGRQRFSHLPEDTLHLPTDRPLDVLVGEVLQYLTASASSLSAGT